MKRILIATDAWKPQVNGVVRTLETTAKYLEKSGFEVKFLTPNNFRGFTWPFYKEIIISFPNKEVIDSIFSEWKPDYIHIATEGTIGLMTRNYCLRRKIEFTTSYHTRFPEYLKEMNKIPLWISYGYLKWFHSKAKKVLVPTSSMKNILDAKDFKNVVVWHRGVDLEVFKPYPKTFNFPKPIIMYVGRVSIEKNIEDFVNLKTKGTKVIVGDGPLRNKLEKNHPEIQFLGYKKGEELARAYSEADILVFPSKTDTYGLVLLEALACGVPFASYPEPGPIDILKNVLFENKSCFIDQSLEIAVKDALKFGSKEEAIKIAKVFSWENCTSKFISYLTGENEV